MTRAPAGSGLPLPGGSPLAVLLGFVSPARIVLLVATILLVAASEGIGILLLVPLLATMTGERDTGSGLVSRAVAALPGDPALGQLLVVFVALVGLRGLFQLARGIQATRLERSVAEGLRRRAGAALLRAEWRTLAQMRQGESLALLVGSIDRIGYGVHQLLALIAALVLLAAAFLAALALSPLVALAAAAGGLVVVLAHGVVRRRALALGEDLSEAYTGLYDRLGETLGALRLIKSFAAEARTAAGLGEVDHRLTANQLAYQRTTGVAQALLQVGGAGLLAVLVWIALERWRVSALLLLPLIALFARVLPLLGTVQQHWQQWLNARPALDQAVAFIASLEAAAEPSAAGIAVARPERTIALNGVGVRHEGRDLPALESVSLVLPVNSTTALVGHSGAGKSTAADVLGGLIAPDEGVLALDGRALTPGERIAWRDHVAYVQQEPVLFHASVRDNLLWAAPAASPADLAQALRDASAEFVLALPGGLDTTVGDLGRQLSGGERQRIVLARALLRRPALLILDEPTSNLDPANEAAVAEALARIQGTTTILIIGHRGLLTQRAERVIRLEQGRVALPGPSVAA